MSASAADDVHLQWGVHITMRDGVQLHATLYLPDGTPSARPALFVLTPYIAQTYHETAHHFASHHYPFLCIDVRGRGNSEGSFDPLRHDADDGYDCIDWISRQPWCDGQVAMWGGSYSGHAQWVTAARDHPALKTIVPVASPAVAIDFPLQNNIWSPYVIQWLTLIAGRTSQDRLFWNQERYWAAKLARWFESGRAFRELDSFVGYASDTFQHWLAHPTQDDCWDTFNPSVGDYARISIPVLTITGICDGDQRGALAHYRAHTQGEAHSRRAHYLVIGPWDHAGTRAPKAKFAGIKTASTSLVDLAALHREWYAWVMEGAPRPAFLAKKVTYYVLGAEEWRHADTLDQVTAQRAPLFLSSTSNPIDPFHSGSLSADAPAAARPDCYTYDPSDVSHAAFEIDVDPMSRTDQRMTHVLAGRQLVYHSAPFASTMEICGFFSLHAWLAIDQPDTDFQASVYEIDLDGSALLLSCDRMRARHRNNLRGECLIDTVAPLLYRFETFPFIARRVPRWHRLRLVIGPINSIAWQRNFNSAKPVAEQTIADARPVTVRLFHDSEHPSCLYIPLGEHTPPNFPFERMPMTRHYELFELIHSLVLCHSPSGVEGEIDAFLQRRFREIGRPASLDASGNLIVKIEGSGGTRLGITAHKDEIGACVTSVEDQGRVRVRRLGGAFPWIYGEGVVDLLGDRDCVQGVLSFGSRHVSHASPQFAHKESAPVRWQDAWIETKLDRAELATAGVRPGTRMVVGKHRKAPFRLKNHIASYTLDNKASLAIILILAQRLKDPRPEIYLIASTQEEVGATGALYFTRQQPLDALIALEIAPISSEYQIDDGAGPVLFAADEYGLYHEGLNGIIRDAARTRDIPLQLAVANGFGSDGSFAMKEGHVPRAACLGFPTQNTHGYEIASLDAIAQCIDLLEAVCERGIP